MQDHTIVTELKTVIDATMAARRILGFAQQGMQASEQVAKAVHQTFQTQVPTSEQSLVVLNALEHLSKGEKLSNADAIEACTIAANMVKQGNDLLQRYQGPSQDNTHPGMR